MCLMLADDSALQVYLVGSTLPRRVHFRGTNKVQLGYSAGVPIVIPHRTRLLGSNPSYATGTVPQAKYGITSKYVIMVAASFYTRVSQKSVLGAAQPETQTIYATSTCT